ncbi:MAG: hypothetical protein KQH79_11490 [Bacteroidetes bacterium]|nr:hypothetical protein [Bacteroidota bacterium]
MANKVSNIQKKLEDKIANSPLTDKSITIFSGLLGLTKYGAPFSALINHLIPNARLLRLEKFVNEIAIALEKLDEEVKVNYLETDEFAFIFEKCIKSVIENYQEEKIEAFKNIFINSLISDNIRQEEKEFFLNLTNQLTVTHIKILDMQNSPDAYLEKNGIEPSSLKGVYGEFLYILFPNVAYETIKIAYDDLYNYGLSLSDSTVFNKRTDKTGYDRLVSVAGLTVFGELYVEFITKR